MYEQKTAYEMRISDWSSDVCSSDLLDQNHDVHAVGDVLGHRRRGAVVDEEAGLQRLEREAPALAGHRHGGVAAAVRAGHRVEVDVVAHPALFVVGQRHLEDRKSTRLNSSH